MKIWFVALALWPSLTLADGAMQPMDNASLEPAGRHACSFANLYQAMKVKGEYGVRAVKIDFRVASDGSVKDVVVAISSDDPLADAAAIKCAQGWRYHPATKDGQPIEVAWHAVVHASTATDTEPQASEFDTAASDPAVQACSIKPAADLEKGWSILSTARVPKSSESNDVFECVNLGNAALVCRAKPGTKLYPSIVETTFYSTGTRLKLGVDIQTAGDCKITTPMTFRNKLPTF